VEALKNRAWHEVAAIDLALENGVIDEGGWFRAMVQMIVPAYLAADNPRAQSGHSGDEGEWEAARRHILSAVDGPGTFLDVGCANGHLMETLTAWAAEDGVRIESYGVDISPELVALARRRLPQWARRIWVGNALTWQPPIRFDYVRTGLEYAPPGRRGTLVSHLLRRVARRRLIIGSFNEEPDDPTTERELAALGFAVAGRSEMPHRDPRVVRRVLWINV